MGIKRKSTSSQPVVEHRSCICLNSIGECLVSIRMQQACILRTRLLYPFPSRSNSVPSRSNSFLLEAILWFLFPSRCMFSMGVMPFLPLRRFRPIIQPRSPRVGVFAQSTWGDASSSEKITRGLAAAGEHGTWKEWKVASTCSCGLGMMIRQG